MLVVVRVKMRGRGKKVNRTTYNISSIKRVTRKFLEVSRCSRAKHRQRNVQKKGSARAKLVFCQLDLLIFFGCFRCRRRLALHDFTFCLSKLYISTVNESFAFSPGYGGQQCKDSFKFIT